MTVSSSAAASSNLILSRASPSPMLMTILLRRGTRILFSILSSRIRIGAISASYLRRRRAGIFGSGSRGWAGATGAAACSAPPFFALFVSVSLLALSLGARVAFFLTLAFFGLVGFIGHYSFPKTSSQRRHTRDLV